MIELSAATVLLQWATGGLLFLWVTTRRREVGIGYGWLLRGTYLLMAAGAFVVGRRFDPVIFRDIASFGVVVLAGGALAVSVARRRAGVANERERTERRSARVAAMTGVDREATERSLDAREFPPVLDIPPFVVGLVGLVVAGAAAGDPVWLSIARTVVGALFLGAVTDAMLLGHWYLVQPQLGRGPIGELNDWLMRIWPFEVALLLVPTGMISALNGTIDDGYNGLLGWFWVACAITTIALAFVTKAALKERAYSAVMAATGLLYLAILTAFGTDLVGRAILSG